jgi:hypothetical protein
MSVSAAYVSVFSTASKLMNGVCAVDAAARSAHINCVVNVEPQSFEFGPELAR